MEKRYQVFVSSTYMDLQEERMAITHALLSMDCIPVGMELFPASNEEKWEFIKTVIDSCDFYLCVIGGCYGTIDKIKKKSYTQMEFEHACETKKEILSFVRKDLEKIPIEKRDKSTTDKSGFDTIKWAKLIDFKNLVTKKSIVNLWEKTGDLTSSIKSSIYKAIQKAPKTAGWIRIDRIDSEWDDKMKDVNLLRKLGVEKINYETGYGISDTEKVKRNIESAKEIKIIATTGRTFIELYNLPLRKAMENGCQVNMLVATEQSEYVNDLHNLQRNNKYDVRGWHDLNEELAILSKFFRSNKPVKANKPVILGHFNTHFRANIVIIDEKIGFYTPTLPPKSSSHGISFELVTGEILSDCLCHFDSIMDEMRREGKVEEI